LDAYAIKRPDGKMWCPPPYGDVSTYMTSFLIRYCPDLLEPHEIEPCQLPKLVLQKPVGKRRFPAEQPVIPGEVIHDSVRPDGCTAPVIPDPVIHSGTLNFDGWTVRADDRGNFRAFKKIGGRTRCVYVGKDLSRAEEKIAGWLERQQAKWAGAMTGDAWNEFHDHWEIEERTMFEQLHGAPYDPYEEDWI
jgi:hypothetical protein